MYLFLVALDLVAASGLSLTASSRDHSQFGAGASHCGGFSCCRAQGLSTQTSVIVVLRLRSCGTGV